MRKIIGFGLFLFLMSCFSTEEVKSRDPKPEFKLPPGGDIVLKESNFFDLGNGTVMEFGNRLIWQKCALGQKSDIECSGQATLFNSPEEAKKQCGALKLNGRKWKIPTREDQERFTKSDYKNFFPNTQFSDVHCISDDNNSFTDNKNGTVTDKETKLTWQICSMGMVGYLSECVGKADQLNWDDAVKECESLDLAGKKWRLPKISELQTISLSSKIINPTGDIKFIPNTETSYYWSSSTDAERFSISWQKEFYTGRVFGSSKSVVNYVRCVTGS